MCYAQKFPLKDPNIPKVCLIKSFIYFVDFAYVFTYYYRALHNIIYFFGYIMSSPKDIRVINITRKAAGLKVKETYEFEAIRRGRMPRLFIADAIAYACKNKSRFKTPLKEARLKEGSHISIQLDKKIKDEVKDWAAKQRSNQALWANYLLEKIHELELLDEI